MNSGPLSIRSTCVPQRERLVELVGKPLCGDRPLHNVQQGLPGVFIDHRRDLDRLTIDGRIELKVRRPHHFRGIGFDLRSLADAGAFAGMVDPNLQTLLLPEPVHLLLVHRQAPRRASDAPSRVGSRAVDASLRTSATRPSGLRRGPRVFRRSVFVRRWSG